MGLKTWNNSPRVTGVKRKRWESTLFLPFMLHWGFLKKTQQKREAEMWRQQSAQAPTFWRKLIACIGMSFKIFFMHSFFKNLGSGWSRTYDSYLPIKKSKAWKFPVAGEMRQSLPTAVWVQTLHLSLGAKGHNSGADKPFYIWGANHMRTWTLLYLGFRLGGARNRLIFDVQTMWGQNQLMGACSCFLSEQDFTSAHSNPVILHC